MSQMLYINEANSLSSLARRFPAVVVCGPRGNSKTHLVRQVFPSKDYIDLGNETIYELARKSPKTFLLAFPQGAVINEAHRIPQLVETVRYYIDKWGYEPGRYILITSKGMDITALQDRGSVLNLISPTIEDLSKAKILSENPFQYIQKGHFAKMIEGQKDYGYLLENDFKRDFSRHINAANKKAFLHFLELCAPYSSRTLSMNSIARNLGISAPTVKTWIAILQAYNIVTLLHPNDESSSTTMVFNDSGMLCHLLGITTKEQLILSPYKDPIVKSHAIAELIKGRYSKAQDHRLHIGDSCDLCADWKAKYSIFVDPNIEVTQDILENARELARKSNGESKTIIMYLGDVTYSQGSIDCIGYLDWTKFASGIDYFS